MVTSQPHLPLSVFIIAKNEEDRIAKAIESVIQWADEVIVIDSGSVDNTVNVAKEAGAKVLFHEWAGYGQQKRFGEDQCKNEWILNIDADERVSDEARTEILSILSGAPQHMGYQVRIVDVMPFETVPHPKAWAVTQIRLYNINHGRFRNHATHDAVVMDKNKLGSLTCPFHHQSVRSLANSLQKANYYTSLQAEDLHQKGRVISTARLLIEFPLAFLKAYFLRRYYIYGLYGFSFSMLFAFSKFLRLAKCHEKQLIQKSSSK